MPEFSVAWNRKRLQWSKRSECAQCQLEAILCERTLMEGKPVLRVVARLAGILEDEIDDSVARADLWNQAQR